MEGGGHPKSEAGDSIRFISGGAERGSVRSLDMLRLISTTFVDAPYMLDVGGRGRPWTAVAGDIADQLARLLGPEMPLSHGQVIAAFASYLGDRTRASASYARKLRHLLRQALNNPQFTSWLHEQLVECRRLLHSVSGDGASVTDEGIVCRKGDRALWTLRRPGVGVYPAKAAPPVSWAEGHTLLTAVASGGERSARLEVLGEAGERLQNLVIASSRSLPYRCMDGTWFLSYTLAESLAPDEHALVVNAYYFFHYPTATCAVRVGVRPKPLSLRWRLWSSGRAHAPLLADIAGRPTVLFSGVLNVLFCHHPDWPLMGKSEFVRVCGSLEWEQPARDVQSFDGRAGPAVPLARWRWLALLPPVPTFGRLEQGLWQDQSGLTWIGDCWRMYAFDDRGAIRSTVSAEHQWQWFGPGLSRYMAETFLGGLRGQVVQVPQFDEPGDGYEWFCRYYMGTYIPAVEEMADWVKVHWSEVKDEPFAEHWKPWLARARACRFPPYETYISWEDKG
jgi:hypothetical protein